jgi:hypothetical protein
MLPWLVPVGLLGVVVLFAVFKQAAVPVVVGVGAVLLAVVMWRLSRRADDQFAETDTTFSVRRPGATTAGPDSTFCRRRPLYRADESPASRL